MSEIFLKNNKLIPQKEWEQKINNLREVVDALPAIDYEQAKEELKKAIINAIKKRIPDEPFGIFFSGGVDSTFIALICKKLGSNFNCYTTGYKEETTELPEDIVYAEKIAKDLDLKLVTKLFNLSEAEKIIEETTQLLNKPKEIHIDYVVKVGVGSVIVSLSKFVKEKIFFSGLGSEEIFAGYERHKKAKDVHAECWYGLTKMRERDLERDCTLAEKLGFTIVTPFMDEDVIKAAMRIDISKKIDENHKKIVLREIAEEEGLQKLYAWRKKKGAQYGSKFDRALGKLAKKAGLKFKKEYLKSLIS